ncbi:thiamine phosphate synthase [Psychrobacter sp. M13]|uniref:thiamine phosphate synthase n=1 Tax=Psychrobacter sp. M13 TaxID=3067275 RepID=UPI00273A9DE5|nr:thiamine phosphate synthase [Psychrobacter sp. M13]WLP95267.1 thiamine phosphate synthase [Psychrobacter sp. M13]
MIIPKLYLLTNDDDISLLLTKLKTAFATNLIAVVQIRRKQVLAQPNGSQQLYDEALEIIALAQQYKVAVVINDDTALAAKLGVGVHLGQGDGDISTAKQLIAADQIIGRTCHGDSQLVKQALEDGADYAAMGAVFASMTKPQASIISREQLNAGCQLSLDKPLNICVIGGLSAENIGQLAGLPLTYIAVVGDIMDLTVEQIAQRCQQWQQALSIWQTLA